MHIEFGQFAIHFDISLIQRTAVGRVLNSVRMNRQWPVSRDKLPPAGLRQTGSCRPEAVVSWSMCAIYFWCSKESDLWTLIA